MSPPLPVPLELSRICSLPPSLPPSVPPSHSPSLPPYLPTYLSPLSPLPPSPPLLSPLSFFPRTLVVVCVRARLCLCLCLCLWSSCTTFILHIHFSAYKMLKSTKQGKSVEGSVLDPLLAILTQVRAERMVQSVESNTRTRQRRRTLSPTRFPSQLLPTIASVHI